MNIRRKRYVIKYVIHAHEKFEKIYVRQQSDSDILCMYIIF